MTYTLSSEERTKLLTDWYGIKWPGATSACVRTGGLKDIAASSSPGNSYLPLHAAMRRCILNDEGIVQYYLNPDDSYNRHEYSPSITGTDDVGTASKVSDTGVFTLAESEYKGKYVHNTTDDTYALITAKDSDNVLSIDADIMDITEEFEICTAGLGDGGDGQVMVEIPAFYYRYSIDSDSYPNWDISTTPFDGASIHPAFIKNGQYVPFRYMSAYEGSMYKISIPGMVAPANIVTAYTIESGDKLCSMSGEFPKTNETRDEFRNMSNRRGSGWRQYDYDLHSAILLLYLIEYADFNSQVVIGDGRTELSSGTWVADSYIGKCGKSNGDGNNTNAVDGATNAVYMTYRGIENIYGNIWNIVDGININDKVLYISNNDSDFQDDTEEGYTDLNIITAAANNYIQTLLSQDRGFLPATVGAGTTMIPDFFYQAAGWCILKTGGVSTILSIAGMFCFDADNTSSYAAESGGSRLAY